MTSRLDARWYDSTENRRTCSSSTSSVKTPVTLRLVVGAAFANQGMGCSQGSFCEDDPLERHWGVAWSIDFSASEVSGLEYDEGTPETDWKRILVEMGPERVDQALERMLGLPARVHQP